MKTSSLTEILADHLAHWRMAGMPSAARTTAHIYVLDWLGSALAGCATPAGRKLLAYAEPQPIGACHILGSEMMGAAETAAFVNGGLSHIVEMDDLDRGSVTHPGAVVIPAALAVAEREGASGKDFLSAVVAGFEVVIRIGEAVGKRHYYFFHNTSTCGVFGAAAAAGWLLGLTPEQIVWALGNAGTQAAGLWQFNTEGDMSKHLHTGRAAASGILAADLAVQGFTGARHILEGERGFFNATAPDAEPARVVDNLEKTPTDFKISDVSIKPHASCRHTHPAIDAALALRTQLAERTIAHVQIDTYQAALDLCDNPDPQTAYAAKFSLYYCVACTLQRGSVGLADFAPDKLVDPTLRTLMTRISARVDSAIEQRYPQAWSAQVTITLQDGTVLAATVDNPKGDPENQLTPAEMDAKFHQLAAYGGHGAQAEAWLQWVAELSTMNPLQMPGDRKPISQAIRDWL